MSDIHGNQQDEQACRSALRFVNDFKPDIRVIAGDLFDFAAIRNGASDEERSISMADDYEAGKGFANEFFKGGKENVLMMGNHDVRAWDLMASNDGVKADLGRKMVADIQGLAKKNKAKLYPYDSRLGVYAIGHLNVVHGYHTGMSACAAHSRIYGNVVFGHVHSIESFQTPGLKQQEARAIGCLCRLNQHYIDRKTAKLRWGHGFVSGLLYADGSYDLFQIRGINGRFTAPVSFKSY